MNFMEEFQFYAVGIVLKIETHKNKKKINKFENRLSEKFLIRNLTSKLSNFVGNSPFASYQNAIKFEFFAVGNFQKEPRANAD